MLHDNARQPGSTTYNSNDILTRKEAAKYLRLAEGTLGNWNCEGKGPRSIKIGRAVRYRFADIEAFIAESSAEVAA